MGAQLKIKPAFIYYTSKLWALRAEIICKTKSSKSRGGRGSGEGKRKAKRTGESGVYTNCYTYFLFFALDQNKVQHVAGIKKTGSKEASAQYCS